MSTHDSKPAERPAAEVPSELQSAWRGLELPEPAPAPPGFTGRVMARVRLESGGAPAPRIWRWAPAGALVAGLALGSFIALELGTSISESESEAEATLAESYLDAAADASEAENGGVDDSSEPLPAGAVR